MEGAKSSVPKRTGTPGPSDVVDEAIIAVLESHERCPYLAHQLLWFDTTNVVNLFRARVGLRWPSSKMTQDVYWFGTMPYVQWDEWSVSELKRS